MRPAAGKGGPLSRRALVALVAGVLVVSVSIVALAAALRGSPKAGEIVGTLLDRPAPDVTLIDQSGRLFHLAERRGSVVVLAPFLTLCHESCPLTTGAFEQLEGQLSHEAAKHVLLVEATVDPGRDTPKRLRAFANLAGVDFRLVTGQPRQLTRLWHSLGVSVFHQPEGDPPDRDWLTGKPLGYDVIHTDALFIFGPDTHLRFIVGGMALVHALPKTLEGLLNAQGHGDLRDRDPGWTVNDALVDIRYLLAQPT